MIRPTPSAEHMAAETLRLAYEGEITSSREAAERFERSRDRVAEVLADNGLPDLRKLVQIGRILRAMHFYLDGPPLDRSARRAGWGGGPDMSRACKECTGRPAGDWKSQGASLGRILEHALRRHGTAWRPDMEDLHKVVPPNGPSLGELWDCDGLTRPQRQARLNRTYRTILGALRAHGFRWSNNGNQFTAGPCIECREVHERKALDPSFRCEDCGGSTTPEWLERERELHRQRMRERDLGKRPQLEPVVFVDASGKPFPARAW